MRDPDAAEMNYGRRLRAVGAINTNAQTQSLASPLGRLLAQSTNRVPPNHKTHSKRVRGVRRTCSTHSWCTHVSLLDARRQCHDRGRTARRFRAQASQDGAHSRTDYSGHRRSRVARAHPCDPSACRALGESAHCSRTAPVAHARTGLGLCQRDDLARHAHLLFGRTALALLVRRCGICATHDTAAGRRCNVHECREGGWQNIGCFRHAFIITRTIPLALPPACRTCSACRDPRRLRW